MNHRFTDAQLDQMQRAITMAQAGYHRLASESCSRARLMSYRVTLEELDDLYEAVIAVMHMQNEEVMS